MPDLFRCRCSCVDPILLSVAIPDDHFAMKRYQFQASCATKVIIFDSPDYLPEWTGDAPTVIDPDQQIEFCDTPTEIHATMTAAGIGIGDVEIKIFDEADTLIARYLNAVVWQPNCWTQFTLVEYLPTCGEVWDAHPCLGPLVDPCSCGECNGSRLAMSVLWTDVNTLGDGYEAYDTTLAARHTLECYDIAGGIPDEIGAGSFDCIWRLQFTVENCPGGEKVTFTFTVWTDNSTDRLWTFASASVVDCSDVPITGVVSQANIAVTLPADDWCDGAPWEAIAQSELNPGSCTITPVAIPETTRPEIRFDCTPRPEAATCNGESLWTLKAYTQGGRYEFYWRLDSDTCAGTCNVASCHPGVPYELPSGLVDSDTADALGLLDDLNTQLAGSCGCVEPYVPPSAPTCEGTSLWYLRRKCEVGFAWIYYWVLDSDTCASGTCTCNPGIPFPLSTAALNDGEAAALGYDDLLDTLVTGTCGCDAEEYVPPDCFECETCDDNTGARVFTLSGFVAPFAYYNGTYTLTKGTGSCTGIDCCWYGMDGESEVGAVLFWSGGVWTLQIDEGVAVYEVVDGDCATDLSMTKTFNAGDRPSFPDPLAVAVV